MLGVNPLETTHTSSFDPAVFQTEKRQTAIRELENYFARMMLKELRESVGKDPLFPQDMASKFQHDMLFDAFATEMTNSGQLGLADMIGEQLRIQEMQADLRAQMAMNDLPDPSS